MSEVRVIRAETLTQFVARLGGDKVPTAAISYRFGMTLLAADQFAREAESRGELVRTTTGEGGVEDRYWSVPTTRAL